MTEELASHCVAGTLFDVAVGFGLVLLLGLLLISCCPSILLVKKKSYTQVESGDGDA